jgi:hypothetical protein
MDKTSLYIQKLIVLILVFTLGVILLHIVKIYFLLPALFFTLSFLVSRITGEKPSFLFGIANADEFLNKKAGFWVLFKWIMVLFGLVYDFIAWTIYGVFILFTVILDFILLVKTIIFWIIHAFIWFLKQFVPPLVFIFKMKIHYIFRWGWWIYKMSFNNIRISINRNFYFISLWGAILMVFVMLLFYGVGILMGVPELAFVGAVFALLPLVWSYGEISSIRLRHAEQESYQRVRNNFQSGFDAVRAILIYFIIFLALTVVEVVFNVLGWIPQIGFSFMGLAINVNTMSTLILLFIFVILVFAKLIMPPHIVCNQDFKADLNGSLNFLGVIGNRFLRYVFSVIPTGLFGAVVMIIPGLIIFLSIVITLNLKNTILDTRINLLNQRVSVLDGLPKYQTLKDIERINYFKSFPGNVISGFGGIKSLNGTVNLLEKNILQGEKEMSTLRLEFSTAIDSLDKKISENKLLPIADSLSSRELARLESIRHTRLDNFSKWEQEGEFSINKMKVDLADKKGLMIQLPVVFLFSVIWASLFFGLVLTFLVSYLGNVYFELYNFKEDENPSYFRQVLSEMNSVNRNQPLLGFTLISVLLLVLLSYKQIAGLIEFFILQFKLL